LIFSRVLGAAHYFFDLVFGLICGFAGCVLCVTQYAAYVFAGLAQCVA
jgi:membrane-associated phospholipid phosphatase